MMMQKQQDKLQADEATLITMDKAQCADEPVVLRDGRHRKCKASQNAGSEYAAPKPQCKKLGAGAGKSFAHHRPTLTKKHMKRRHTVKSAFHKSGRPKWMPEMPKGIKLGKEGFFASLIFV